MPDIVTKQLIPLRGIDFSLDPAKIPWSNWAYNLPSIVFLPVPLLRREEIRLLAKETHLVAAKALFIIGNETEYCRDSTCNHSDQAHCKYWM